MPHEELVIFTMQLLNLSNVERELIQQIAQQCDSTQYLDDDDARRRSSSQQARQSSGTDIDLLSMSPQEGLCDVSGVHNITSSMAISVGELTLSSPVASRPPPSGIGSHSAAAAAASVTQGPMKAAMLSVPAAATTPSTSSALEEDEETQNPVMWKLNLLTHIDAHHDAVRVGGDAWGED